MDAVTKNVLACFAVGAAMLATTSVTACDKCNKACESPGVCAISPASSLGSNQQFPIQGPAQFAGLQGQQLAGPQGQQFVGPQGPQVGSQGQQFAGPQGQQFAGPQGQQIAGPQGQQFAGPPSQQFAGPQGQQFGPQGQPRTVYRTTGSANRWPARTAVHWSSRPAGWASRSTVRRSAGPAICRTTGSSSWSASNDWRSASPATILAARPRLDSQSSIDCPLTDDAYLKRAAGMDSFPAAFYS